MVEVLRSPSLGPNMPNSADMMEMTSRFMNTGIGPIQEEQADYASTTTTTPPPTKEGNFVKNGSSRGPRRAFTSTDYQLPASPGSLAQQAQRRLVTPSAGGTPNEASETATTATAAQSYLQAPHQAAAAIASSPVSPRHPSPASPYSSWKGHVATLRLPMGSPKRSYSLMDVEPVPLTHQPGTTLTLPLLPPELHYALFDFLDPIDGTCLALTSKHFYAIYRRMYPGEPVSLAARREGPNDMEWVWRNAGPFLATGGDNSSNSSNSKQNSLAMLSPRGQVYCRKCRTQRCELHKHIREWMGEGREYCEVTQKFGRAAPPQAKAFCFRSSPKHPHRCGRHTRQQRAVRLV
ncbi:hypothetical protein F4775DRAFT_589290 [Biscogniauxia sp. FL1348]|nr:hypothetical protein F4775DRAFT_589290 [Biscogniauxia sp. FL1348]